MSKAFGLDFGTSNSVLGVASNGSVDLVNIDPASTSKTTLPSVLFFDEEGGINIGVDAIEQYLNYGGMYGRFMQSVKTFLPSKTFTETYVFGKRYELEDLIALILKTIKHRGELHVGHMVNTVVMGRPVLFSEDRELDLLAEERLQTAAMRSGFTNIQFMYEPIAATLAYESGLKSGEERLVLMGDFGGGTSDFVVMRLHGGVCDLSEDRASDILATGGIYIGGDTFDAAIMWNKLAQHFGRGAKIRGSTKDQILDAPIWLPQTLCQRHMIPRLRDKSTLQTIRSLHGVSDTDRNALKNLNTLIVENLGYMLFREVERVKRELSVTESSVINFDEHDIMLSESITRDEFEVFADEKFRKLEECVDETLTRAEVLAKDIDSILLTGGSSLIPRVQKIFVSRFGADKILPMDAFTSVAYGLALAAARL